MRTALLATLALLLLTPPIPGIAKDGSRPERADLAEWAGVWILDRDASDPIGPLMKLLDLPWIARKVADVMTPILTITVLGDGSLRMVNENPIQTTDRKMPADGIEREREAPTGRRVVSSEVWSDAGQLVAVDQNHIDDDRVVVVTSTWARVREDLVLEIRLEAEDGPLVIHRIFRRKP